MEVFRSVKSSTLQKRRLKCTENSYIDKNLKIILNRHIPTEDAIKYFMLKKGSFKQNKLNIKCGESEQTSTDELCVKLLNEEKNYIYNEVYEKIEDRIFEINTSKEEKSKTENKSAHPTINKNNLKQFFSILKKKDQLNRHQKDLKNCLDRLNSSKNPLWITPIYIMKAINDCVLNRKWNNLTQLLLILLTFPPKRYKPVIRHVSVWVSFF